MSKSKCPFCKSENVSVFTLAKDWQIAENKAEYPVYHCPDCAILFQYPFPAKEDFDKIYPNDYYAHIETEKIPFLMRLLSQFLKNEKTVFQLIKHSAYPYFDEIKNAKKVLDIGCGKGVFLNVLKGAGKETHGLEPDPNAVKILEKNGHHAIQGDIFTAKIEDNSYDLVTMFQVIEHIDDHESLIREVYRILKPGGYFIIETPNFVSSPAKNKNRWVNLDMPRHLIIHSPQSIKNLLGKEKFQTQIYVRVSPSDIKESFFLKHNIRSPFKRKLFSLLLLPYTLFQYLFNASKGSLLIAVARKS
jgi:2-polyprenyl-3-methyl-5-hydroxy-6-metoxy-1,4-benzoquinol methylase